MMWWWNIMEKSGYFPIYLTVLEIQFKFQLTGGYCHGQNWYARHARYTFIAALMSLWPEFWFDLIYHVSSLSTRAINAGKSALNEDQARCEVLVIKRKPGGNPTSSQIPMTRRRSSLPNGEGVDPPSCSVSETPLFNLCGSVACARWRPDASKWWMYSPNKHVAYVQGVRILPL